MRLNPGRPRPITGGDRMFTLTPYLIPERPPTELLVELDAAAAALDELTARAAQLALDMDATTGSLRIELDDGDVRLLTPTQLLDLL